MTRKRFNASAPFHIDFKNAVSRERYVRFHLTLTAAAPSETIEACPLFTGA